MGENIKKSIGDSVESIKEGQKKLKKDIKEKVDEFKDKDMIVIEANKEDKEKNQNPPDR